MHPDSCKLHPDDTFLCPDGLYLFSVIFSPEVDQIKLVLYNQMHIDQALELLRAVPGSQEVLTVRLLPTEGDDDPVPEVPSVNPTMERAVMHPKHIEGRAPPKISRERGISTHMSLALGLQDQESYSRLIRYLQQHDQLDPIPVEALGNCMFSSIRRAIDVPLEYQNVHLRRQIVMVLANNAYFFIPLLKNSIMAIYGHPRMEEEEFNRRRAASELSQQQIDDQECPGPFSFYGYLRALLVDGFWGDEIVLMAISMMFQCGVTILDASTYHQTKVRHNKSLKDADIVLVHCQGRHYVPVCKYPTRIPLAPRCTLSAPQQIIIASQCIKSAPRRIQC